MFSRFPSSVSGAVLETRTLIFPEIPPPPGAPHSQQDGRRVLEGTQATDKFHGLTCGWGWSRGCDLLSLAISLPAIPAEPTCSRNSRLAANLPCLSPYSLQGVSAPGGQPFLSGAGGHVDLRPKAEPRSHRVTESGRGTVWRSLRLSCRPLHPCRSPPQALPSLLHPCPSAITSSLLLSPNLEGVSRGHSSTLACLAPWELALGP